MIFFLEMNVKNVTFNLFYAGYFYVLHSSPFLPDQLAEFQLLAWKTVLVLKPADMDLHCFPIKIQCSI